MPRPRHPSDDVRLLAARVARVAQAADAQTPRTPPALAAPVPRSVDEDAVAQLLIDSEAQHRLYQQAIRDFQPVQAIAAVTEADRLRRAAEAIDPTYRAVAWRINPDRWPHQQLLQFYRDEIPALTRSLERPSVAETGGPPRGMPG